MAFVDLFRPKWKHSNCIVRKLAVEKLTDKVILTEVANTDSDWNVRKLAHELLGNEQKALAVVILNDKNIISRKAAVEKVTDKVMLNKVAETDIDWTIRKLAHERLGNGQNALVEIIKNDKNISAKKEALLKLDDQKILTDIAKFRNQKLYDELKQFARNHNSREVSDHPSSQILADEMELAEIATGRIFDCTLLSDIAMNSPHTGSRRIAIEKLSDLSILEKIAKSESNEFLRKFALERISQINSN